MKRSKSAKKDTHDRDTWCILEGDSVYINDVEVSKDSFSIGRKAGNDLFIQYSKISAIHCTISREEKSNKKGWEYFLEDTSSNGTFCNGKKIGKNKKISLKNGDEITLLRSDLKADSSIVFYYYRIDKFYFPIG